MKKQAALILAASMLATSLAGCSSGGGAEETTAATTAAAAADTTAAAGDEGGSAEGGQEPVTIRFSWWGGESRHQATLAAVDAFMEEYPWITVECEYSAWDGWQDKVATQLAGGTAPDLMQINWDWLYHYSGDGSKFVDLNEFSDIISLENWPENNLQAMNVGGKLQGVPISVTSKLMMFNKTTFEKAGIEIPTTWDELLAAGKTFQEVLGDEYYPMENAGYERFWIMVWYLQQKYGKPWVENMEVQYTLDEVIDGMNFINAMEENHVMPTIAEYQGDGAESLLVNPKWMDGRYAGVLEYDSAANNIVNSVNEGQESVMAEYPTMDGAKGFGMTKVSQGFAITETSEHKEEAALLLEFLTSNETGVKLLTTERGIPCNTVAMQILEDEGLVDPNVAEANRIATTNAAYTFDPNFEHSALKETTGVYYEVFDNLSAGGDVTELAQYLIDSVNDVNAANPY